MIKNNNTKDQDPSEFDAYQEAHVPLFEAIYGENLISLGGTAAIDNMFNDLNITGLTALDIGFGLGGVAFHLAEKYKMKISGIEVNPWMVQYAEMHAPKAVTHLLTFNTYDAAGNFPYKPESFDLVYSKGVLNHIADKNNLFQQIHAVLKPSGLFVIADWIFPQATTESSAPLVCETKESYERVLTHNGFKEITFRNDSELFLDYTRKILSNLVISQEFIEQKYGQEIFSMIWNQHEELIDKITQLQKLAVRIITKK